MTKGYINMKEIHRQKFSNLKGFLMIAGIVLIACVCIVAIRLFCAWIGFDNGDIFLYIVLIIIATMVVRRYIQDYIYVLEGSEFSVYRLLGDRDKLLAQISLSDAVWFGDAVSLPDEYKSAKKYKLTFKKYDESKALVYKTAKDERVLVICPTDKMAERIISNGYNLKK